MTDPNQGDKEVPVRAEEFFKSINFDRNKPIQRFKRMASPRKSETDLSTNIPITPTRTLVDNPKLTKMHEKLQALRSGGRKPLRRMSEQRREEIKQRLENIRKIEGGPTESIVDHQELIENNEQEEVEVNDIQPKSLPERTSKLLSESLSNITRSDLPKFSRNHPLNFNSSSPNLIPRFSRVKSEHSIGGLNNTIQEKSQSLISSPSSSPPKSQSLISSSSPPKEKSQSSLLSSPPKEKLIDQQILPLTKSNSVNNISNTNKFQRITPPRNRQPESVERLKKITSNRMIGIRRMSELRLGHNQQPIISNNPESLISEEQIRAQKIREEWKKKENQLLKSSEEFDSQNSEISQEPIIDSKSQLVQENYLQKQQVVEDELKQQQQEVENQFNSEELLKVQNENPQNENNLNVKIEELGVQTSSENHVVNDSNPEIKNPESGTNWNEYQNLDPLIDLTEEDIEKVRESQKRMKKRLEIQAIREKRLEYIDKLSKEARENRNKSRAPWRKLKENTLIELIDRNKWRNRILKENSTISSVYYRSTPLRRASAFCRKYSRKRLPKEDVLQLIMHHLIAVGYVNSKQVLEEESKTPYKPRFVLRDSRLHTAIRNSVTDVEHIFGTTLDLVPHAFDDDPPESNLGSHFISLHLYDDERDFVGDSYIWDEEPTTDINVVMSEGAIKNASMNVLVQRLTDETDFASRYMKTFQMTYQSYITPRRLLSKLVERYHVPRRYDIDEGEFKNLETRIHIRVINFIRTWIRDHPWHFDDSLIQSLNDFIKQVQETKLAEQIRRSIEKLKSDKEEKSDKFTGDPPPIPKVPKNIFSPDLSLYDIEPIEMARQVTLYDFEMFAKIRLDELLNQSWNKQKLKHRAPNVLATIHRFNLFSGWVATSIMKCDTLRARAKIITYFARVAEHLRDLNNFNSLLAVLAGLNSASVFRLKHTFEEVPRRHIETLERMKESTSSKQSYKQFRVTIHEAVGRACFPYPGIYLTDLVFIDDGNPDYLPGQKPNSEGRILMLINWAKQKLTYETIQKIQQFQLRPYNLQPVEQILNLLKNIQRWSDPELYQKSLDYEPRGCSREEVK